jgi:hypothetical protein
MFGRRFAFSSCLEQHYLLESTPFNVWNKICIFIMFGATLPAGKYTIKCLEQDLHFHHVWNNITCWKVHH